MVDTPIRPAASERTRLEAPESVDGRRADGSECVVVLDETGKALHGECAGAGIGRVIGKSEFTVGSDQAEVVMQARA